MKFMNKNGGFTLVELIVVIAILAILAGVAVPAYSGYVDKANQSADITLVRDVEHALTLHYYNNVGQNKTPSSGYVTLGTTGSSASNEEVTTAMDAVFGDGWEETVALTYDGWALSNSMPSAEDAQKVANSTYYKNSTPAELVSSFAGLTDSLAQMASTATGDPLETMKNIQIMSDAEYSAMRKQLDDLKVSWNSEAGADNAAYTTAVSNLLIQNVSTEIGGYTYTGSDNVSGLGELAAAYAQIYAWGSTGDAQGAVVLENLNNAIKAKDASSTSVVKAVNDAMSAANAENSTFSAYLKENEIGDLTALSAIMGTVSKWSDGADMTTAGLYSSDSITDAVNNYISAVGTMSGMGENADALATALGAGVVVFVSANGMVGSNISAG